MSMFGGAIAINATPWPFKSITGFLVSIACHYLFKRTMKVCLPLVTDRLQNTAKLRSDPGYAWKPPVRLMLRTYAIRLKC